VDPPIPAGSAAPLSKTTNPVTVTIGGQQASVFSAGLAPGFAGLYQVERLRPRRNHAREQCVSGQRARLGRPDEGDRALCNRELVATPAVAKNPVEGKPATSHRRLASGASLHRSARDSVPSILLIALERGRARRGG
jgi:hypothetical protein